MYNLKYLLPDRDDKNRYISNEKAHKILVTLVDHIYTQAYMGIFASLFCASMIFIGLYDGQKNNTRLFVWAGLFLMITLLRLAQLLIYKFDRASEKNINLWRNLYIIGSSLGGVSWGLVAVFLLPFASPVQQMLMILMMAGVTSGVVPLSAGIPNAAVAFLIFSLLPLIISIATFENNIYLLFDFALSLYLVYSIMLTIRAYKLINNSTRLQFENDILLNNLEMINKKLELAATHDPLTKVANRRLFASILEESIQYAKEHKKLLALLYIDLDHFKAANDRYGHQAGDHILIVVIERIKNFFHRDDIIARLGGDELAIIIEKANSRDEIEVIAEKICQLIAIPIKLNHLKLKVSASIGISIYPYDGIDEQTLVRCSDKCMYYVKERGGNNFRFSEELIEE